jgi:hypothetical protein
MQDLRWPSTAGGRSRVVARGGQVFVVANASDPRWIWPGNLPKP